MLGAIAAAAAIVPALVVGPMWRDWAALGEVLLFFVIASAVEVALLFGLSVLAQASADTITRWGARVFVVVTFGWLSVSLIIAAALAPTAPGAALATAFAVQGAVLLLSGIWPTALTPVAVRDWTITGAAARAARWLLDRRVTRAKGDLAYLVQLEMEQAGGAAPRRSLLQRIGERLRQASVR